MQAWHSHDLHPAFCLPVLKIVVMYCPEGPFLWFSTTIDALQEYRRWAPEEIMVLFQPKEWLVADFVSAANLVKVARLMSSKLVAFDCALGIGERNETYTDAKSMYFWDTDMLTSRNSVISDQDVQLLYFETIRRNRPQSNDTDFAWDVNAVELLSDTECDTEDEQEENDLASYLENHDWDVLP